MYNAHVYVHDQKQWELLLITFPDYGSVNMIVWFLILNTNFWSSHQDITEYMDGAFKAETILKENNIVSIASARFHLFLKKK